MGFSQLKLSHRNFGRLQKGSLEKVKTTPLKQNSL